jgi:hypothetical protein
MYKYIFKTYIIGLIGLVLKILSLILYSNLIMVIGTCICYRATQGIAVMFAMQFLARPLPNWERKLQSGCLQDGAFIPQDFTCNLTTL